MGFGAHMSHKQGSSRKAAPVNPASIPRLAKAAVRVPPAFGVQILCVARSGWPHDESRLFISDLLEGYFSATHLIQQAIEKFAQVRGASFAILLLKGLKPETFP